MAEDTEENALVLFGVEMSSSNFLLTGNGSTEIGRNPEDVEQMLPPEKERARPEDVEHAEVSEKERGN